MTVLYDEVDLTFLELAEDEKQAIRECIVQASYIGIRSDAIINVIQRGRWCK